MVGQELIIKVRSDIAHCDVLLKRLVGVNISSEFMQKTVSRFNSDVEKMKSYERRAGANYSKKNPSPMDTIEAKLSLEESDSLFENVVKDLYNDIHRYMQDNNL